MSLRTEQETILRRMQETAAPIRSKLPPDILALVSDQPKPEPAKPESLAAKPPKPEPSVAEPAKPETAAARPESPAAEPAKPGPAATVAAMPAPPPAAEPAKPSPGDKVICKTLIGTGSRLNTERVCMAKREWDKLHESGQQATTEMQNVPRVNKPF